MIDDLYAAKLAFAHERALIPGAHVETDAALSYLTTLGTCLGTVAAVVHRYAEVSAPVVLPPTTLAQYLVEAIDTQFEPAAFAVILAAAFRAAERENPTHD